MIKSDNLVEATILALQGKLPLTETKKLSTSKKIKKENVDVIVNKEDNSTYVETPDTIVTVADKDTIEDTIEDTSTNVSTQTPDVLEVPVDSDETIVPEEDLPEDTVQDIVDSDETIVPKEDLKECNKGQLKIESTETDEDEEDEEDEEEDEEKEETLEEAINRAYEEELSAINTYDLVLNKIENEESNEKLIEMINEIKKDEEDHKSLLKHYIETGEALTDDELEELKNSKESNEDEDAYGDFKQGNQDDEDLQEAKKLRRSVRENKGKFDSKTFNEVFTKYFTQKYPNLKESKVTKLGVSKNGLKIEGVLINKDNKQKAICLEMKKVNNSNIFSKYQVVESKGILRESKDKSKTLNLMIHNKNNVLECKYLIQK